MKFDFKPQNAGETAYLVIDIDDRFEIDSFAMNMMTYNHIANIVQTQMVRVNERRQLQFNVTGLEKMNGIVAVPKSKKEVLGILNGIVNAFEEVDAYMLDLEHLLLDWEYVYQDSQKNCVLIYLPFDYESGKDKIAFLQEAVSRIQVDYEDPYLFDILNAFSRGAIRQLSDFREIIKKNIDPERGIEEKEVNARMPKLKKDEEDKTMHPEIKREFHERTASGSKIPIINIPGREPGGKMVVKDNLTVKPDKPQIPEKKKGFFKKQSHFAIPKGKKEEKIQELKKEGNQQEYRPETLLNHAKNDMYEGYENTVIIQEAFMAQNESDRTVMLETPEVSMAVSAKLIHKQTGTFYLIDKERVMVGSGETVDIRIHNNTVSRNHAVISYINGNFYIEDNGSRNGSFLNRKRLMKGKSEKLEHKDLIRLSNEDFEFLKD